MSHSIPTVLEAIEAHTPAAIICASKGGAYMVELWRRMELGEIPKIPSLMINVHPDCRGPGLPKDTKVILVQGDREDVWPMDRGYNDKGKPVDDSLEALIRTGSPGMCYLYFTVSKQGLSRRIGDSHSPKSLLEHNCLPRLIDALLSEHPPFHFPSSSGHFVSDDRREHENFLGFEPRGLRKFWVSADQKGIDDELRFDVAPDSDEFNAVTGIFASEPAVERFYCKDYHASDLDVTRIERVENGYLHEAMDMKYATSRLALNGVGVEVEGGVHTRWLFHGAGSAETVGAIVEDPANGFNPLLNERGLFGAGVYFARDATYSWQCPGCCDTCTDAASGDMMVLLCLVSTGMPCVGEEGMRNMPKIHDGLRPKMSYGSFVDSASNPEIFVVQSGNLAYPAYIIHFSY